MSQKKTLQYTENPLGGVLDRQLFVGSAQWDNKVATIRDIKIQSQPAGNYVTLDTAQTISGQKIFTGNFFLGSGQWQLDGSNANIFSIISGTDNTKIYKFPKDRTVLDSKAVALIEDIPTNFDAPKLDHLVTFQIGDKTLTTDFNSAASNLTWSVDDIGAVRHLVGKKTIAGWLSDVLEPNDTTTKKMFWVNSIDDSGWGLVTGKGAFIETWYDDTYGMRLVSIIQDDFIVKGGVVDNTTFAWNGAIPIQTYTFINDKILENYPASPSAAGVITTSAQTIAGAKTFASDLTIGSTAVKWTLDAAEETVFNIQASDSSTYFLPNNTKDTRQIATLNDIATLAPAVHTHTASQISDSTTLGRAILTLSNPSAITFPRFNANNTITALSAADFRTAIGAGTSSTTGTVTSVSASATQVSGLSMTITNGTTTPSIATSISNAANFRNAINAAESSHTHTTTLAIDSGTSTITLAHASKYKLTAGGSSVIFTMPSETAQIQTDWNATSGLAQILNKPTTFTPAVHNFIDTINHPVSGLTTGHFLKALSATTYGFAAHGLSASDIGLGNVTNNAQIKKNASSTSGKVPTWNGTTGDALNDGYSVQTTLSSSTTALVRADAIVSALADKQNILTNPVTGTGTANQLTYWTAANTVGTLAVATYPSLTELSYVKGVTSAIQNQINGKQATITGAATTIVSSNLTASMALVSDASGKVAASSISATKLGYLTDVTSNIQAQLNNKQATLTDPVTGTGANKYLSYFNGISTITGDASLQFDEATNALTLGDTLEWTLDGSSDGAFQIQSNGGTTYSFLKGTVGTKTVATMSDAIPQVSYSTTPPSSANTNGIKFYVGTEPATKYAGWIYFTT